MARIVQKYGGTSWVTSTALRMSRTASKAFRDAGNQVVVVVSARAGVTNELIARAKR